MSFNKVTEFENTIAEFYGAPYAVSVDCCTHAIELCLRLQKVKKTSCPTQTYVSVPMTLEKLQIEWDWSNARWQEYYYLEGTNIIDAAVLWKEKCYIPDTLMCVSFQFHKHLSLGKGGMILLDNQHQQEELIRMSYDGRNREVPWVEQAIKTIGYHYYMTPETAMLGLGKFESAKARPAKKIGYQDYPDLSLLPVFNQ
jgi:dTDP-4-amino-4,6-dideoxygalactose transaminase